MKIWTYGSPPRSGSRNAWTRIKNVNGASRLSNSWNFFGAIQMISCRNLWPWTKPGYITMTRRRSNNQLSGGIAAQPVPSQKIPSAKIPWISSRLEFLGSRRHPPHWLSYKGPNVQREVLLISAGATERHFEGKSHENVTKEVLFLHNNAPAHRALATQKKLAYLSFQCLDHPPCSPDLAPSDYHLLPGLKNNLKFAIFRPTRRLLLPRRPGWTDKFLNFFERLAKVRAKG